MPQNIGDNRILEDGIARISRADAERLKRYLVRTNDIVYSRRGDVERRALVREHEDGWLCGTGCLRVRLGEKGADPRYASFYLGHPDVREWIVRHAHGATMPNLNTSILAACPFLEPPAAVQRAIAHILGTLDDKIELNRRMNETLEEMARALFKSWFVGFDPVRAKAEGRDPGLPQHIASLFPSRLADSELGEIPEGSSGGVLDQFTDLVLGGDWGSDDQDAERTTEAYCIRGADIPGLQSGDIGRMPKRFLKPASLSRRQLSSGDLVIEISGGSPTQSTGRPVLVSSELLKRLELPLVYSNFCRLVRPKSPRFSKFLYLWLRRLYQNDEFLQFENRTTGIKNLAFTLFSATYRLTIPPPIVLEGFDHLVTPLFQRHQANGAEIGTLSNLRDALLPKLISGEVRTRKSKRDLAEAHS
jgi:type I restriction enzyme S subunit